MIVLKGNHDAAISPYVDLTAAVLENKTFSENSPPDLEQVATPLEDQDKFELWSPYVPNVSTDQAATVTEEFKVTIYGVHPNTNGSLMSPSVTSEYQLLNHPYDDDGTPGMSEQHPSYVLGAWKPTAP